MRHELWLKIRRHRDRCGTRGVRGGVCRRAPGTACRHLHVVCRHRRAHAVQSRDWRHREGTPRRRDRRARRIDGARHRCDRHPVQSSQSQPRALPCGRRARRPTRSATAEWMLAALRAEPNIEWIFGRAGQILVDHGRVVGLALEDGPRYECDALVITTGTFLNGLVHVGPRAAAGRARERAAVARARRVAQVVRVHVGPIEDRHSPASRSPLDRFRSRASAMAVSRSSPATIRRCRSRFSPNRSRSSRRRAISRTPTIACARSCWRTSTSRRCSTDRFRASARGIVRRSKTRSCGSRSASGIRFISSPKDATSTRST